MRGEYHYNHEPFLNVSKEAKDLISKLLVIDVNKRLSAEEAYNHPWIQGGEDQIDMQIASEAFDNMQKFMGAINFKKAALIYMASKMPERNIEELRKLFIQIDLNGDGKITYDEFHTSITDYGLNLTEEEIALLLNQMDTNGNGYIDYTEFIASCIKSKIYLKEEYIKQAFSYFDKVSLNKAKPLSFDIDYSVRTRVA